ncbi:site-specific integrase [Bacillus thuringiensis]|uniref:Recombinase XerC n=1 Tax=Bacillus thuringiensis TaxID=1428 RepID=A0A9X6Y8E7_BACTU|nr:site-specific integrase [Bacillus thuringiensis]PEA87050.1 recombinase XerC [Bacillus thuringiensis]
MASFRKRNGTWEYRVRYKEGNKYKEKSKGGFKTKKEAQHAAAKTEEKIACGIKIQNEDMLFKNYIEDWLEVYKKPTVRKITYSVIERNVRLNLIPKFGKYKIKEITRNDYQKWINSLPEHYSLGTIRRIHSIMNSAINDAVLDYRILPYNPLQKVKLPLVEDEKDHLKFFSIEELKKLLQHLKENPHQKYRNSNQYYSLFYLMSTTGIRIGEALALKWNDINFEEKNITINKTLVYPINSAPYISKPKTKTSNRTILLDDLTVEVMKKHRINQKEVCLRYINYKSSDENLIFHQQDGRYLRTNVTRDYFKKKCKEAKVPILSPHALRHSHAVHLLESGANIKYVSERLGHASIKTTADTYLHITKKIEKDSLSAYQNYMCL